MITLTLLTISRMKLRFLLILLLCTGLLHAQEKAYNPNYRNVFWMHGMNGNVHSLKAMSDYFSSIYQINSYTPGYVSTRGIVEAANQWDALDFDQQENDFVIAHSMGGLVARQYDYQSLPSHRFGGLITIATPHNGARFANSFDNGLLKTFFQKTLNQGLEGYSEMDHHVMYNSYHSNVIEQLNLLVGALTSTYNETKTNLDDLFSKIFKLTRFTSIISNLGIADNSNVIKYLQGTSELLVGIAANRVFGKPETGFPSSKNDLKYESPIVNSINSHTFSTPHCINIVCKTEEPTGTRFLGSTLSAALQNNPTIGQIQDDILINFRNAIISDSEKCKEKYSDLFKRQSWTTLGINNSKNRAHRDAFSRQITFWQSGFESAYQDCLGSKYTSTEEVSVTQWQWVADEDMHNVILNPVLAEDEPSLPVNDETTPGGSMQLVTTNYTVTHQHYYENDGIVTVPSQEHWAGVPTRLAIKTDHEKAKRSDRVKNILQSEFDNPDSWFYCKRK